MSDTRAEAEKELETIEMSSNLEDSLGSALESSFNLPPPPPAPKKGSESAHEPETIPEATLEAAKNQPEAVEGLDEWKDTLENYTKEWQAESKIAREKALATRTRIEKENADAEKKLKEDLEIKKKKDLEDTKRRRDQERLQRELEEEEALKTKDGREKREREKKTKEAWELVGEKKDKKSTVETDARGTTSKDDVKKEKSKPLSYNPITNRDPIPPVFQDPVPASQSSAPAPTESRHSVATSGAWEEVSRGSPSGSGSGSGEEVSRAQSQSNSEDSDIVNIPSSSSSKNNNQAQPPSQPPSLTLSLFNPSQLTFKRVLAVIGINLVLPFVNGVFLGFGEIFAREVIRVGKLVWRGERTWYSFGRGVSAAGAAAGGRGTTGVGLSGGF